MSFANLPAQMIVLILGWTFTVYLQIQSNNRAEALKRKDKIIDKLEALSSWLESEVSKEDFSLMQSEAIYAGHVSQIEVKIGQLNKHVGKQIINMVILNELMLIALKEEAAANKGLPHEVREIAWNIIEEIERSCTDEYFARQGLLSSLKGFVCHFYGAILGGLVIILMAYVGRFLVDFIW